VWKTTVFFFHQIFHLEEGIVLELLDVLCDLLRDTNVSLERENVPEDLEGA
jgi:hypothetical protein